MLFAALGDIHGNIHAFSAVLDAIDGEGIQTVLSTGDAVVGGRQPNEVVDILRARGFPAVQGEMDRLAARFRRNERRIRKAVPEPALSQLEWTHETLRGENLEYLQSLPRVAQLTIDGTGITLCHGSPASQTESLTPDTKQERFQRVRERANTPVVVCGRTHVPFHTQVADTLIVNPGGTGVYPGEAHFVLVSTEEVPWTVEHRTLRYE